MKGKRLLVSLLVTLALALGLVLPASAEVEPPEVIGELEPGESITIDKIVTTPEIPPKPDIYFLSDTTGSMDPVIAAVSGNATAIMNAISASDPTAQFGVGNYRDYPDTVPPFTNQLSITSDTVAVATAIGAWTAGAGGDGPEGQFYALDRIANVGVGWRSGSSKIVVWFGDAPAHDPVPTAATGLGYDITETTVTTDLQNAGIRVIAISTVTAGGAFYPDALDDDPTNYGGDYAATYGIVEDGNPGQATRIADATGGVHLTDVSPDEIVEKIIEGLEAVKTDVWGVIEADEGLSVTLDPAVHYNIESGTSVIFTETITVAEDAPQCETLTATVIFYANKYPDEGAVIGKQVISIKVKDVTPPDVWCVESVNPHGEKVPPAGSTTPPGSKGGKNEDGFYQLFAEDNCDPEPVILVCYWDPEATAPDGSDGWWVAVRDKDGNIVRCLSGTVVKLTEAPGATAIAKKIGSSKGQAGAVAWHITIPNDALVIAIDDAGNIGWCYDCFVPPPPK